jgi:hypothetical protein
MTRGLVTLALVGCSQPNPDRPSPPSTAETGAPTPPVDSLTATCSPVPDNALRATCDVDNGTASTAMLVVHDQRLELPASSSSRATVFGLPAATEVSWTVSAAGLEDAGTLTTGALPADLLQLRAVGSPTIPMVFLVLRGTAIVARNDGTIVWYEPVPEPPSGYLWADDHFVVIAHDSMYAYELDGTERFHHVRGVDFDRQLHHDLSEHDGLYYALDAGVHSYPDGDAILDGISVFDDQRLVASWQLADHLVQPSPLPATPRPGIWADTFPNATDVSHANGIDVAPDGTVVFSSRAFDQVWALGALAGDTLGEVQWILGGRGTGDFTLSADPTVTTAAAFVDQHHPVLDGSRLTLFDNGPAGVDARTLAIELDVGAGQAEIVEVHDMERRCRIHGAAYTLSNGNTLATCADDPLIKEFAAGTGAAAVWELEVLDPPPGTLLLRAHPVELFPAGVVSPL